MALEPDYPEREKRKEEDGKFILNPNLWPQNPLRVKTQPWVTNATGVMRFGKIYSTDCYEVHEEGVAPRRFQTIQGLTEVWSVD